MSLPTPFYNEGGITIYCGDNRRIVPLLDEFDLLLTDPPYGIGESSDKVESRQRKAGGNSKSLANQRDYGSFDWDQNAPDQWVLMMAKAKARHQIIWGGNYFNLPPCTGPLVWDKENGENDFADGEIAWNNLGTALRIKRHMWNGMLRKGGESRCHPTQKPLDVISWCLGQVPDAKSVLDPWMGSGTTLVAAKLRGLKAVGIEINKDYCEAAVARLSQGVLLPC